MVSIGGPWTFIFRVEPQSEGVEWNQSPIFGHLVTNSTKFSQEFASIRSKVVPCVALPTVPNSFSCFCVPKFIHEAARGVYERLCWNVPQDFAKNEANSKRLFAGGFFIIWSAFVMVSFRILMDFSGLQSTNIGSVCRKRLALKCRQRRLTSIASSKISITVPAPRFSLLTTFLVFLELITFHSLQKG